MLSFHNEQSTKDKYLSRVRAHQKADNLIRGTGWEGGKGCAVGCTLENYDHSQYPVELGIPEWLARVEDTLFEGMSEKKSHTWPEKFLEAIPLGITDEQFERKVKAPFLIIVLESALTSFDHDKFPDVKKCLDASISLWRREDIGSDDWNKAAAWAAEAAEAAAWAARAAEAAARAAEAAARAALAAEAAALAAARAALAAEAAALAAARAAALAAAWAAEAAAWAAEAAKYDYFADELLRMLSNLTTDKE
jgi:hypothetical protein